MVGRGDVRLMICKPGPGMSNRIVSVSGLALASIIACRKELIPLSFVLLTVKVAPTDGLAAASRRGTAEEGRRLSVAPADSTSDGMVIPTAEHSATRRKMLTIKIKADRECEVTDPTMLFMSLTPLTTSTKDSIRAIERKVTVEKENLQARSQMITTVRLQFDWNSTVVVAKAL